MKLILTGDVDHLGTVGETVEVKDGYGRNFLLPRGMAILASRGALRSLEAETSGYSTSVRRLRGLLDDAGRELERYTAQAEAGAAGWAGEESLDVEMVHALAPDATLVIRDGTNPAASLHAASFASIAGSANSSTLPQRSQIAKAMLPLEWHCASAQQTKALSDSSRCASPRSVSFSSAR